MKNLEKALFNVAAEIGTDYEFPTEEIIIDELSEGGKFRNPFHGQPKRPLKFAKGTRKELLIWLKDTKDKYPVMWLVYPKKSRFKNDVSGRETYPKLRLVFAMNNTVDKSVNERIHTTQIVLDSIVSKFLELMRNSAFKKYISIDKSVDCDKEWFPNFATSVNQDQSAASDIWDVIILDCTMILIPACIPVTPKSNPEP